jgi:acyl-CoA thioester hydrolase
MFTYDTTYRVRYADVDPMGYMYYGNYARLYEIGRVESLRSLELSYKAMEEGGIMMPVYENKSRYLQPAKYDDLVTIRVYVKELPKARMIFNYDLFNEEGTLLNQGETTLVFVKMDTNRLTVCPEAMRNALAIYFS